MKTLLTLAVLAATTLPAAAQYTPDVYRGEWHNGDATINITPTKVGRDDGECGIDGIISRGKNLVVMLDCSLGSHDHWHGEFKTTQRWTLSADQCELTIESKREGRKHYSRQCESSAHADSLTCAGHLTAGTKGYLAISECAVPKGQESFALDLSDIAPTSRALIARVCGMPQSKGMEGPFCRVEATTVESGQDDTFKAVKVLRVTK
jgi:hypothetical protein